MMTTPLATKTDILSELWMNYRFDEEFEDFVDYNDLGLPLAFLLSTKIVKGTEEAENIINETFDLLLAGLEMTEDTGFESLDDLLGFGA